jgi:hypothetical protein
MRVTDLRPGQWAEAPNQEEAYLILSHAAVGGHRLPLNLWLWVVGRVTPCAPMLGMSEDGAHEMMALP